MNTQSDNFDEFDLEVTSCPINPQTYKNAMELLVQEKTEKIRLALVNSSGIIWARYGQSHQGNYHIGSTDRPLD